MLDRIGRPCRCWLCRPRCFAVVLAAVLLAVLCGSLAGSLRRRPTPPPWTIPAGRAGAGCAGRAASPLSWLLCCWLCCVDRWPDRSVAVQLRRPGPSRQAVPVLAVLAVSLRCCPGCCAAGCGVWIAGRASVAVQLRRPGPSRQAVPVLAVLAVSLRCCPGCCAAGCGVRIAGRASAAVQFRRPGPSRQGVPVLAVLAALLRHNRF